MRPARSPPSGTGVAVTRFTDIWDKGKAAVIWSETTVTAPDGTLLWTQKRSIFARGEGGFGGERGPSTSVGAAGPRAGFRARTADAAAAGAALPACAATATPCTPIPSSPLPQAFRRPILHGLCTYGMTCKALVDAVLDGDVAQVGSYGARFAGVLFPGETLKASVWKRTATFAGGLTAPERDDAIVLSGVELTPA